MGGGRAKVEDVFGGTCNSLVEEEQCHNSRYDNEVVRFLVFIDKQRGKQEVVYAEDNEVQRINAANEEGLVPLERLLLVERVVYIQAEDGGHEGHQPQG